jgi:hypothetical protein
MWQLKTVFLFFKMMQPFVSSALLGYEMIKIKGFL